MTTDRLTKALLALIAVALTTIAVNLWIGDPRALVPASAEAQGRRMTIPKAWGKAVGFIPGHVYLENEGGTIRLVNLGATGSPIGAVVFEIDRN